MPRSYEVVERIGRSVGEPLRNDVREADAAERNHVRRAGGADRAHQRLHSRGLEGHSWAGAAITPTRPGRRRIVPFGVRLVEDVEDHRVVVFEGGGDGRPERRPMVHVRHRLEPDGLHRPRRGPMEVEDHVEALRFEQVDIAHDGRLVRRAAVLR